MKNRLNRIVTRTGDEGRSSLVDGTRLSKSSLVFRLLGDIDELNVVTGFCLLNLPMSIDADRLIWLQQKLFDLGGLIALNQHMDSEETQQYLVEDDLLKLEGWLKEYNESLQPLKEFVLPNGNEASLKMHWARVVCRRVERTLCEINDAQKVRKNLLKFINRLSDLFFVLARVVSDKEQLWEHDRGEI
ncbi:MAG TPA: cob(I)yrinic acid a,c-diamide adenosyltransferase [Aeromonadales bacterium]|nr:cob(I)yrinic acid a,c-diamide adenosyltransferase [Aeromonadales bacterium]